MEVFIFIVLVHWIADFIFQAEAWSIGKSKSWSPLLKHTVTYATLWFFPVWLMTGMWAETLVFVGVTFVFHTATDYFTSRLVSRRFAEGYNGSPIPNFGAFTIIGFDQVLHYVQLILTWHILFGLS